MLDFECGLTKPSREAKQKITLRFVAGIDT
jgi:hypothetical protein